MTLLRASDVNYEDIRESFVIALENAGVDADVIHSVVTIVDDYVDNHYEKETA